VTCVDDIGTIHVKWDTGSSLGIAYGADACRVLVGEFTDTVRSQILAVRDTGETNMFDVPMVQQIANRLGYYELVLFLIDHKKEYAHFIMTGEIKNDPFLDQCRPDQTLTLFWTNVCTVYVV
jgi:hypothetical protein